MPRPSLFATRRRLAAGWLFLISRRAAVTTGFHSPSSAKCISSPSKHHEYRYKYNRAAAFTASKRHSNMSTTASYNSNSNTAAVTVAELPTKWSETITTTTNNNQNANLYDPKYLFPPLSSNSHKGSHGRIAILGGSNKYTGAPFYAAQAALNCGVDLATIFCATEASVPIKCYSPELMVQGVYSIQQLDELLQEEEELLSELEKYKHKNDLITVNNNSDENNNNSDDNIASSISLNKLLLEHDESNSSRQTDLMIQRSELLDDTKKMDDIVTKLQKVKQLQESLQEYKLRQEEYIVKSVQDITDMFVTLHALCVGPGLGRHPLVFKIVQHVLRVGMECNLTLILDADVLYMLSLDEYDELYDELLQYEGCIMTPNMMEMKRLSSSSSSPSSSSSSMLGDSSGKNNIIVEKGHVDAISRGDFAMQCSEEGGLKRSGGIGDVLAGTISAYMAWYAILKRSDDVQGLSQQRAFAVWTACCTVKRATKLAFEKKRRTMSSRDVLNEICGVIMRLEEDIDRDREI